MGRRIIALLTFLASIPTASAQIANYGYSGSNSIFGLMSHLLGIDIYRPYAALGVASTIGIMWVSVYIIFKIAIKKMDEDLGDNLESPFADAFGLNENDDDRNILAVFTLLIVLAMLGTGAFTGLIQGWQALIILTFTLLLLAGLIFLLVGGTGGIIGGTAYTAGVSAEVTAQGVEQLKEGVDRISDLQDEVEDQEREEEDDIDEGNEDEADEEAEITAEELERIIQIIDNVEGRMNELLEEEEEELEEDLENLRRIVELLGEDNE